MNARQEVINITVFARVLSLYTVHYLTEMMQDVSAARSVSVWR